MSVVTCMSKERHPTDVIRGYQEGRIYYNSFAHFIDSLEENFDDGSIHRAMKKFTFVTVVINMNMSQGDFSTLCVGNISDENVFGEFLKRIEVTGWMHCDSPRRIWCPSTWEDSLVFSSTLVHSKLRLFTENCLNFSPVFPLELTF